MALDTSLSEKESWRDLISTYLGCLVPIGIFLILGYISNMQDRAAKDKVAIERKEEWNNNYFLTIEIADKDKNGYVSLFENAELYDEIKSFDYGTSWWKLPLNEELKKYLSNHQEELDKLPYSVKIKYQN